VDYDALHGARFRDERTLWNELGDDTGVRFFPVHSNANQPVAINIVENGTARALAYDRSMFDMPADNPVAAMGANAGFSGFRVMNTARDADWLVFMGASYFRAAGAEKQYGLSARAITIDTSRGQEEFPRFTTFWLERTGEDALTVYALLDGPSIAGAYRFRNRLDSAGVHQDVDAALFPRKAIAELGLMPMTSMFWYDQAHRALATDWRPEIHDSDGLLIRSGDGVSRFRALANPRAPRSSDFPERNPKGFGLLQRDRKFDHYQDDGVYYDRRPTLWATPTTALGAGNVRLYEFPTDSEYTDNVACYWTPAKPVRAGQRIDAAYRLDWQSVEPDARSIGIVENVWRGKSDVTGATLRLVVDFAGLTGKSALIPDATLENGTLVKKAAYPILEQPGAWRAVLDIAPAGSDAVGVQLSLIQNGTMVTERFHYPLLP
jgi:glucans biosynthesis protein